MALPTRPHIPEVLVATLILVAVWPWGGPDATRQTVALVELPIPAKSLLPGISPLSPGQQLTLKAFAPEDKSFVTRCFTDVSVRELEHQGDTRTVLIAMPASRAFSLEEALANEKVRFTYNLVDQRPGIAAGGDTCAPAMPDVAPAEAPPSTPSHATLELPSVDLQFQAGPQDRDKPLRLVVAMSRPAEGQQPPAVLDTNTSTAATCVKVTDFLDAQGLSTGGYDAQRTKTVRVQLPSDAVTAIVARLAAPSRIWMLPDESCNKGSK